MSEIIYSAQKRDFIPGHRYANPRLFNRPRAGITSVIVVGSWPKIAEAYRLGPPGVIVVEIADQDALREFLDNRAPELKQTEAFVPLGGRQIPVTRTGNAGGGLQQALTNAQSLENHEGQGQQGDARSEVTLPDDPAQTPWPELRSIASRVSSQPIMNRVQAQAAIDAERVRRAAATESAQ